MAGEVEHLVGEAPLVVIPGDELDEVPKMPNISLTSQLNAEPIRPLPSIILAQVKLLRATTKTRA